MITTNRTQFKYSNMGLVRSIHTGAKTILAHFHYTNRGTAPLEMDWNSAETPRKIAKVAALDEEQIIFMKFIANEARKNGTRWIPFPDLLPQEGLNHS
jgi:hypothetical protein